MPFGDWSWPDPLEIPDSSPDESVFHYCRFNVDYLSFVLGAIENLLPPVTWAGDSEQVQLSLSKIHSLIDQIATAAESEPLMNLPIGTVLPYAGSGSTESWIICDGRALSRMDYPELFAVIGEHFGGDGPEGDEFNVPDLRGRTVIGAGDGTGLTPRYRAETVGAETHQLTVDEMPAHTHAINRSIVAAAGTQRRAIEGASSDSGTQSTGGDQAHNNMQPSLVLEYIIYAG